jgi:16S rRNA (guanine(1405)-N(7))-methyltransferase
MPMATSDLDRLVDTVVTSSKYRQITPALVRNLGAQELLKRRNLKEAVKATKNKLHQIAAVYQEGAFAYDRWYTTLQAAPDQAARRAVCATIMAHHASTRERLPLLESFYTTLFTGLPPITSLLDLACGLNPLAVPWMPLAGSVRYYAYDIYQDQIDFLSRCLPLLGVQGRAQVCDLLQSSPTQQADVALLLKTIPCLEQADKEAGRRLLDGVNAPTVIVSFPLQSLGGHGKGMAAHYERHFYELVAGRPWRIDRFVFSTELVYRLQR